MSRTALHCFLALGISVSLAAACGDDDPTFPDGNGGNAGNAGSSGMAGSGGSSGGSSGSAGMSGSGGSSGTGGTGGAQGGTGGGSGGDGGSAGDDDPDAGDGGPDGSVVEPDASTGGTGGAAGTGGTGGAGGSGSTADCPANQNGIAVANNNQELAIVRVLFDGAGQVVIRNVATLPDGGAGATQPLASVFLCNGPDLCVDLGEDGDCTETGEDDDLLFGEEATCDVPGVLAEAAGELALLNAPAASESSFIRSYVAWGNVVSAEPERDAGTVDSLEVRADDGQFWTLTDRIPAPAGGQDAIYAIGNLGVEAGYDVCTED